MTPRSYCASGLRATANIIDGELQRGDLETIKESMKPAPTDRNVSVLLDRIVPALAPEAVYLFGSRAGGKETADSDYDLLVVVPDETTAETIRRRGRRILLVISAALQIFYAACWQ